MLLANNLVDKILGANAGHKVAMYYFGENVFFFKNGKVKTSAKKNYPSFSSNAAEVVCTSSLSTQPTFEKS